MGDAIKEITEKIEEAEENVEKASALGKNVTLIKKHITEMTAKHIVILQEVLEKVPEQAKPTIEKTINKPFPNNEKAVENIEKEELKRVS